MRVALVCLCLLVSAASAALTAEPQARESKASTAAKLNAQLGIAYLQRGNVALAQQKIERALSENAGDPDVQTAAALLYDQVGEYDKASTHYQAAMRADPSDPNRANNYGGFLCRRGSFDRGQKLLEETASNRRYATPEVALTNAGVCARQGKNLERAEQDFRKALEINGAYSDALLQMADLGYTRGDMIMARGFLSRLLGTSPPSAEALLLGFKIEKSAGDARAAKEYGDRLRREFPDAPQVRELNEAASP